MENPEKWQHKTVKNKTKHNTQYVLDTTIRKQTQIEHEHSYKLLVVKTTEHSVYVEPITDITTQNKERKETYDRTTQKTKKDEQHGPHQNNSGITEG